MEFWPFISKKRKIQSLIFVITLILGGFSELISISSVVPFISVLTNKSEILNNQLIIYLLSNNIISEERQIFVLVTLLFALASIFSLVIRLFNIRFGCKLAAVIGNEISTLAYWNTINMPFINYSNANSGAIIAKLSTQMDMTINSIECFLAIISSFFIAFFIILTLLIISPEVSLSSILILGLLYVFIVSKYKNRIIDYSTKIGKSQINQVRIIQESLGNFRDIVLGKKQNVYSKIYKSVDLERRSYIANSAYVAAFPRYIIETSALLIIALLGFYNIYIFKEANLITILGVFALGIQKLLPAFQGIYSSYILIKARETPIKNVLGLLKQKVNVKRNSDSITSFNFKNSIEIRNVDFGYDEKNIFLNNISFTIKKGDKVGIIGMSGSGKSTLMDIVMGLLVPLKGDILVDGESIFQNKRIERWQEKISHLSQFIFLNDASFLENITMDSILSKKQKNKAIKCAKSAHIHDYIESTEDGYYTNIGERGIKLSGGQRQRLGIARSLYLDSQILILDEATSSLDRKTEESVINTIKNLDKNLTILMITHREKCLQICDFTIKIGTENNDY